MESLRRPAVLAAIAAAVLVINVVVLNDGDEAGDRDTVAGETTDEGAATADGTDGGADGDAAGTDAASGDGNAADDGAAEDGAATDGDTATDEGTADGDGASDGDEATSDDEGLVTPPAGTYTYASSGGWTYTTAGGTEEFVLPATATATVGEGDTWEVRLAAGDDYADRFTFRLGADGGLDWTAWVLERVIGGDPLETSYVCSGSSAFYRPDEAGRTADHDCQGPGILASGSVEHVGTEDVQLGDGTTVTADRLLYTYTLSGSTSSGEYSGDGRFEFWVDPATGLRLREIRRVDSSVGDTNYLEEAEFLLESLTPA